MNDLKVKEDQRPKGLDKSGDQSKAVSTSLHDQMKLLSKQEKKRLTRFFEILNQINEREKSGEGH